MLSLASRVADLRGSVSLMLSGSGEEERDAIRSELLDFFRNERPDTIVVESEPRSGYDEEFLVLPRPGQAVCDFCNASQPVKSFTSEPAVVNALDVDVFDQGLDAKWAACSACVAYIERGDQRGLEQRAMREIIPQATALPRVQRDLLAGELHKAHDAFWRGFKSSTPARGEPPS